MPSDSIPTLIPIKRGAAIDWKATALAEHEACWAHQQQSEDRKRVIADQTKRLNAMETQLATAHKHAHDYFNTLQAIRAHWSAFLLPRELR